MDCRVTEKITMLQKGELTDKEGGESLYDLVMQTLDNQLRSRTPPETKETYDRLIAMGYPVEEVRRLISLVITMEIYYVMKERRPLNMERFIAALKDLPREPFGR